MRTCDEPGCDRGHYARGWCKKHYLRAWTAGTLDEKARTLVKPGATLDERLRHTGWTVTDTGCWEWNGSRHHGYGMLAVGDYENGVSRPALASRTAYKAWKGEDPGDMAVCHTCDNPPCINPDHLFLGSRGDNARDMSAKQRNRIGEFHSGVRLLDAEVAAIRERYAAGGVSQRALAAEYGVSQQLISSLVRFKRRERPTVVPAQWRGHDVGHDAAKRV